MSLMANLCLTAPRLVAHVHVASTAGGLRCVLPPAWLVRQERRTHDVMSAGPGAVSISLSGARFNVLQSHARASRLPPAPPCHPRRIMRAAALSSRARSAPAVGAGPRARRRRRACRCHAGAYGGGGGDVGDDVGDAGGISLPISGVDTDWREFRAR